MRVEIIPPPQPKNELQIIFTYEEALLLRSIFGHGGIKQWRAFIGIGYLNDISATELANFSKKAYALIPRTF